MRILRSWQTLDPHDRSGVVAIGNFDGLHRGHAAVLDRARAIAAEKGAPFGVLTFEPHPRNYFQPDAPPFRLTPLRPKARQLEAMGVDLLYVLHFDAELASKTAEAFIADILAGGLGARHVVVGDDFVFGKGRGGDGALLEARGVAHGFGVTRVEQVAGADGGAFSSTVIRAHLREGRPAEAAKALGRLWEVEGHVTPGDQRGRTIGFPTANLDLEGYLLPRFGVYAVRMGLETSAEPVWCDGVANLGLRPTIGDGKVLLEAHMFDRTEDLYGRLLRVQLVDFIRPEVQFDGLDALKAQIARDCDKAREILAAREESAVTPAARGAEAPA
ncbi:MAG: bifunctional riboflavin kinase/FAD synthetase [Bauldia litoralis]